MLDLRFFLTVVAMKLPSGILDEHNACSFMPASCLAYFSTLKTEVVCSSEMSVDFHQTAWHYITEDRILHPRYNRTRRWQQRTAVIQ
jgi:hypothetical protein